MDDAGASKQRLGLRGPHSPALTNVEHARPSPLRIATQIFGVLLSVALLVWVAALAFTGENSENLDRLRRMEWDAALWLLALQAGSIVVGAFPFWLTLLPARRLSLRDLISVNAIATMLSPLPFKISVLSRVLAHRRWDGMRFVEIAGWFTAMGGTLLCTTGTLALASVVAGRMDALWWAIVAAGVGGGGVAMVLVSRFLRTKPRLNTLTLGAAELLAHPGPVAATFATRFVDMALFAGRFAVASAALGRPLDADGAVLAASVYLISGVFAPSGTLGAREGAVAGMALLPVGLDPGTIAAASLIVTGGEIAASLPMGMAGAWRLRAWRLLSRPPRSAGAPAPDPAA